MRKRRLGKSGLTVTSLGFGGAPIGRVTCSERDARKAVWEALERGITLVDTSPHYGLGTSERRIGEALRERPDLAKDVVLSTKTGHYGRAKDFGYDATLRSVEASLGRLGVDRVDIVHIHDVHDASEMEEILRSRMAHTALRELQDEGVIGSIGVGTKSLPVLDLAIRSGGFDVVMMANQYNLLDQHGRDILEQGAEQEVGVIIAGAYATGVLAKGSQDSLARYRYRPVPGDVRENVAEIETVCQKWRCPLASAAVQYCLRGPAQAAVTVLGARNRAQAASNAEAVQVDIPNEFWTELDALIGSFPPRQPH